MKAHFLMMAHYNIWANARIYRAAALLPDELYRKNTDAFFKSLHGTLNHLLNADRIWMWRLTGSGPYQPQLDAIVHADLPSLSEARHAEDKRLLDFVEGLSEPQFEELWDYKTLSGAPQRQRRREILAHVFNHQTHHRGQAHVILTSLGVAEPESLDLVLQQRERPQ